MRDKSKFIIPNNYSVNLNRVYSNISKIVLRDIIITNSVSAINNATNLFLWKYPNNEDLRLTGQQFIILPLYFVKNGIDQSFKMDYTIINKYLNNDNFSDQYIYKYKFKYGFYSLEKFIDAFSSELSMCSNKYKKYSRF